MKILFLTESALLGGHVLSAFTVARGMQQRGHAVIFAAGRGKLTPVIQQKMPFLDLEIPILHGTYETYFTWKSLPAILQLKKIVEDNRIEMIHAFHSRCYIHAYIVGLITNTPVTSTLCGGIDPYYNIPVNNRIIVFSEEQRDKMVNTYGWKRDRIEVIRTRLDIDQLLDQNNAPDDILPELNIRQDVRKLMMISSFDSTKKRSIFNVIEAMESLYRRGIIAQMIFIGGKGDFFEQAKLKGMDVNNKHGENLIVFTGPVVGAYKLLSNAVIVLGVGRSAFEGMAYAKPTIIVGENGFAGIVSKETVGDIAYYNFSGRNRKENCSPEILADEIENLLSNTGRQAEVGMFVKKFVMEEIDVKLGLQRIEAVYRSNIEGRNILFKMLQWLSLFKIMIPIWRDNLYHDLKSALGIQDVHLRNLFKKNMENEKNA